MVFSRAPISFSDKKNETLKQTDCKKNYDMIAKIKMALTAVRPRKLVMYRKKKSVSKTFM
jgi:hypothetical protein